MYIIWNQTILYLDFTARQNYFTHFEPRHLWGGAKTVDPREKKNKQKKNDHPQAELSLSHMWPELVSNPSSKLTRTTFGFKQIHVINYLSKFRYSFYVLLKNENMLAYKKSLTI